MLDSNQKSKIAYLRKQGFGYKRIAAALDLPVATIKYHCRKNGFKGKEIETVKPRIKEISREVQKIKQAEMDYRLTRMMVDYLLAQKLITKRVHKATIKNLIEKFEPILGSLEHEYGK